MLHLFIGVGVKLYVKERKCFIFISLSFYFSCSIQKKCSNSHSYLIRENLLE